MKIRGKVTDTGLTAVKIIAVEVVTKVTVDYSIAQWQGGWLVERA